MGCDFIWLSKFTVVCFPKFFDTICYGIFSLGEESACKFEPPTPNAIVHATTTANNKPKEFFNIITS